MAIFTYTALDKANAFVKGKLDARSVKAASAALEQRGLVIVNVRKEETGNYSRLNNIFTRVSRLEKIFTTRHLSTMLEAGIALDQALKIVAEQTGNPVLREALLDIQMRVQKGQTFAASLAQHPKYFSPFFISLIRVGESSGKLDQVLAYLLEQQERDYELITKTRSAMLYPAVILGALALILVFMMVFVVPRVTAVLQEYNVGLPLATRILVGVSSFIINYGLYVLPVIIILIVLFRRWLNTPRGKWWWDGVLLKLPKVKTIVQEFQIARATRAMSSMLKSGVSIDQAIALAADVAGNSHYHHSLNSGIKFVQKGIPLSEVIRGYPKLYPPLTSRMLEIGEKTGKLDHMFSKLASFYEKSVITTLNNMASIVEPLLLLTIGLAVGFLAVAVLTPIWKFAETI